ncbi:MAG TPA: helix-turn-helix domain-containing GNAT family N-acetyltransferase [Candidatus Dormibacteraeota bacterium]|nr:helix-turn-helix domain-containing GNAT family N-acetyltransferase [Candidatus Dormibacteraeota bacterium]
MAAPVLPAPSPDDPIQTVRRFNRFYTRQIGVLQEHLLQSQFSLTEVRVLYELAQRETITAKDLCRDLGLDRGYLSRMLQSFETHGWIKTAASPDDRRRQFLSLTAKGHKVFDPLERRSSEEVAAMLARLSPDRQKKMLAAIHDIESVLAPSQPSAEPYILRQHRPGDMGWVVQRHGELYWREYRYDERFEALVAEIVAEFIQNLDPKRERCWIAEKDGENVGAVFLVKKSAAVAKLRLLLVEPSARGLGIGRRLVQECVRFAKEVGYKKVMLWTQSELAAARGIYQGVGFRLVADEKHSSWSRDDLIAETWELKL